MQTIYTSDNCTHLWSVEADDFGALHLYPLVPCMHGPVNRVVAGQDKIILQELHV